MHVTECVYVCLSMSVCVCTLVYMPEYMYVCISMSAMCVPVSACVYACLIVCKYTYTYINVFVICVSDIHVCVEGSKQEVLHQLYFGPPWIIGRKLTTGSGVEARDRRGSHPPTRR